MQRSDFDEESSEIVARSEKEGETSVSAISQVQVKTSVRAADDKAVAVVDYLRSEGGITTEFLAIVRPRVIEATKAK